MTPIIWVEDLNIKEMHGSFAGKAFTLCEKEIGKEMKFKTLYDYSNFPKCKLCQQITNNIYKGVM